MTTLIAWVGADSRGPASVYLASDSRISFGDRRPWDRGQKLFSCSERPVAFGYCGDAFFPVHILSQLVQRIDAGLLEFGDPHQGVQRCVSTISEMLDGRATTSSFTVVVAQRRGEGMSSEFLVSAVEFSPIEGPRVVSYETPMASDVIGSWGSGAAVFREHNARWLKGDAGGTSRAVFSAFADAVRSGEDALSSPPPQLIGLYRKGSCRSFGIIWEQRRYFRASEVTGQIATRGVQWHNALFEICDPNTLDRAVDAQAQPRPRLLHEGGQ